jgi:hypothetical protein
VDVGRVLSVTDRISSESVGAGKTRVSEEGDKPESEIVLWQVSVGLSWEIV